MLFRRWLRRWRFRRWPSWSQEKLGQEVGISGKKISRIELGKTQPDLEDLIKFAAFFGEEVGDFLVKIGYTKYSAQEGDKISCNGHRHN